MHGSPVAQLRGMSTSAFLCLSPTHWVPPSYWIASHLGIYKPSGVAGGVLASTLILVALHGAPRVALPLPLALPASTWVPLLVPFPKTTRVSTHSPVSPHSPKAQIDFPFENNRFPYPWNKIQTLSNLENPDFRNKWSSFPMRESKPFYSGWNGANKELPLWIAFQLSVQDDELSQIISTIIVCQVLC